MIGNKELNVLHIHKITQDRQKINTVTLKQGDDVDTNGPMAGAYKNHPSPGNGV